MSLLTEIQGLVRARDYRFTIHAAVRMTQRNLSVSDVEDALLSDQAEIIEDYSEDPRGPSCLILGFMPDGRPAHVQCTYPPAVAVVTAYEPDPEEWLDWRIRKGGDAP